MIALLVLGSLTITVAFAAWLDKERGHDLASLKGDVDGHFNALYGRFDDAEKRAVRIGDELARLEGIVRGLQDGLAKTQTVIDSSNDELFALKTLSVVNSQPKSQKKKKTKKTSKKR